MTVECAASVHCSPEKEVGAPPATSRATMVITPDGVSEWLVESEPREAIGGFRSWLFVHHPDALEGPEDSAPVEEFREWGLLWAKYAREWAEFLDARDCAYPSDCFFETPATGG